jgi:hypothetical protein
MSATNEWGVPTDWWDTEHYPGPQTHISQWAWEFLRRNPEYRRLWDEKVLPFYNATTGEFDLDTAWAFERAAVTRAGGTAIVSPIEQLREQFGTCGDPRQNRRIPGFNLPGAVYSASGWAQANWKGADKISMGFDLEFPLNEQISRAKFILGRLQKRAEHRRETRLRDPQLYRSYLRILDAKDAGVSIAAIALRLFPICDPNARQTVLNHCRAARRLRDGGYWFLADQAPEGKVG